MDRQHHFKELFIYHDSTKINNFANCTIVLNNNKNNNFKRGGGKRQGKIEEKVVNGKFKQLCDFFLKLLEINEKLYQNLGLITRILEKFERIS